MQQPHPDHTQPSIQYSNQQYHQLQTPMMLCPVGVQFVYEPQMVVPPDEPSQPTTNQTFQNQAFLLNVQNTPPWIQNRPNMVYMPQMQMTNNIQSYIPQQMVQSPMFNYQYQPMMMQEQIRHIVPNYMTQNLIQSPQMVQNVTQNPQTLVQNQQNVINTQNIIQSPVRFQQVEQKRESPLLTHILQNNVSKPANQNEFASPMQIIRPQYQNVRPQMIIVNPIASHTCTHNQQKEPPPVVTEKPQNEIPQHIRNQIPEGLSVKTVFKIAATAMVKPTDVALQNIAPADDAHPRVYPKPVTKPVSNRDPQVNYKRKIRELLDQTSKDESEIQAFKRNCLATRQEAVNKNTKVKIYLDLQTNNSMPQNNLNTGSVVDRLQNMQNGLDRPQMEEKLLRNTVYVQARGRVNEMIVNEIQNTNIASNPSIMETNNANQMQNNVNENVVTAPIENQIVTERIIPNQVVPEDITPVQERKEVNVIENSSRNEDVKIDQTVISKDGETVTQNSLINTQIFPSNDDITLSQNSSKITPILPPNDADDTAIRNNSKMTKLLLSNDADGVQNNSKMTEFSLPNNADDATTRKTSKMTQMLLSKDAENTTKSSKKPKITHKVNKNKKAETKKLVDVNNCRNEPIAKYVLTHVLDGHIIQESNVPFIVQKPTISPIKEPKNKTKEAEPEAGQSSKETETINNKEDSKNSLSSKRTEIPSDKGETEVTRDTVKETLGTNNKRDVGPNLDKPDSKTVNRVNEDDPFKHLSRATVKSWTVTDVTSHLMNHQDWRESAQKLREEEIDGESLFLVNKDQLLRIGICEEHAQVLSEFLERE